MPLASEQISVCRIVCVCVCVCVCGVGGGGGGGGDHCKSNVMYCWPSYELILLPGPGPSCLHCKALNGGDQEGKGGGKGGEGGGGGGADANTGQQMM